MSDSGALHDEAEVDDNLETPAKIRFCETLLPLDGSACAITLSVVAVLHVAKVKTSAAISLLTFISIMFLVYGASNLVWRLKHKSKVSDLRAGLRLNDELRSRGKIGSEEWNRMYHARIPKEWPLIRKINIAGDMGIDFSLLGLALFSAWVICQALRLS